MPAMTYPNLSVSAPVDLVSTLSLSGGAPILVQVIGQRPARLAEAAVAPADSESGHQLLPGATWSATVDAGANPIWCWSSRGTVIVVSDA